MGYPVKQSSATQPLNFLMVQSSDHLTGATGLSPTVKLSKNGGTGVSPSGSVLEIDPTNLPGWYKVSGHATDTNTLGPLLLHASAAGADPADDTFNVVAYDPQAVSNLGLTNLDAAVTTRSTFAGGAVASVTAGVALASNGLDAVVVETGLNARQALSVIAASGAGVLAGATGTTITIAGAGVVTNRITATVDANGNRTAVTVSPPT